MNGKVNRPLRVIAGSTMVVLVSGASLFSGQSRVLAASPSYYPPTGFGGYSWEGKVTQISAQWVVPTLSPSNNQEAASTWVGAQNSDGGPPFIQLGTVENVYGSSGPQYGAFWSDPDVHFHPQILGLVHASDLVSADMTLVRKGWSLTFKDVTRGTTETKIIRYGAGLTYSEGEWLQEDPTSNANVTVADIAYPTTSTVGIAHLLVNHSPPRLCLANAQVLISSNGIILVPSAVTDDSFQLSAPTGMVQQYLEATRPVDAAVSLLQASLLTWNHDSMAERTKVVEAVANAYGENASAIGSLPLPTIDGRHSAALLEQRFRKVQEDCAQWIHAGLTENSPAFIRLRTDQDIAPMAYTIREALGLPPPS